MSEELNGTVLLERPVEQVEEKPVPVVTKVVTETKAAAEAGVHAPIEVKPKPVYDFFKRVFDIVVSLICLTVGLPVYLIMILAIVIDDPGNPFFVQERVGLNGRVFKMVKLRTMRKDAEKIKVNLAEQNEYASVHFKIENDPRVTKVGKFLRKTSLDETPQVLNLLTGKMSLIGPRPLIPREETVHKMREQAGVYQLRPGMTGWAQVNGRDFVEDEEKVKFDQEYFEKVGVKIDLQILWLTVKKVVTKADIEEGKSRENAELQRSNVSVSQGKS